jgi:hypothetical protein
MKTIARIAFCLSLLFLPHRLLAQDANFIAVFKSMVFEQNNPFVAALRDEFDGDQKGLNFGVFIAAASSNSISSASVQAPVGGSQPLNSSNDGLNLEVGFESKLELDATYPDGNYTVTVNGTNDGARNVTVNLSGDAYPATIRIANWSDAQAVDAGEPFTLSWDPIAGGSSADALLVKVRTDNGSNEQTVFETPFIGAPGQLTGSSTSVVIPANLLAPGTRYEATVLLIKTIATDLTYSQTIAAYLKDTKFPLRTTGGTDSVSPNLDSVTPSYNTSEVEDTSAVAFTFNEPMDSSVDVGAAISWTGVTPGDLNYSWSSDGLILFAKHQMSLPLTEQISWTLNPSGTANPLQDAAGNDLPADLTGSFTVAATTSVGQTDLDSLLIMKAQGLLQTNATPIPFGLFAFELNAAMTGFNTVRELGLSAPPGGPILLDRNQSGDEFDIEAIYALKADLDGSLPNGLYTSDIVGFNDGNQTIGLDMSVENYPNDPTVLNFSTLASVNPTNALVLSWTAMTSPGANDFIRVTVKNTFSREVFETSLPGEVGALAGSATSVTIPAGTLAPGRTYEVQLRFAKSADLDTSSYPGVRAQAAFAKVTLFDLTTIGVPLRPRLEVLGVTNGQINLRVHGEYRSTYSLDSSMTPGSFNYIFTGRTETRTSDGMGTFDFTDFNSSTMRFFRAFE